MTGSPTLVSEAESSASASDRTRSVALLVASTAPLVVALVLSYRDGGYFTTSWGGAAIVVLALVAAVAVAVRTSAGGPLGWVAAGGWVAFAVWQGLSGLWSDEPAASTAAMGLTLLYAASFILVLLSSRGATTLRRLVELSMLVVVPVTVSALGARLVPAIFAEEQHGRLSTPISYWNNLGLLFAFGFVVAVGIAADGTRRWPLRAAAAATIPMFPLGILFAQSRGALVALVVGAAVLVALTRGRIATSWMLAAAAATSIPLLVHANAQESLTIGRVLQEPHDAEGRRVVVVLLIGAAACALASLVVVRLGDAVAPGRRRLVVGGALVTTLVVVAAAALIARPPDGGPTAWADRQFESFKRYDPRARDSATTVADRLAVAAGSGRWQNWAVAADQFAASPVAGTGAGDYRFRWAAERDIDVNVRNAHSLYLEVLGESGLIGLLLLLTPVAAVATGTGLALRRGPPAALARDLGIAAAAGSAVLVHLAGDWAWQMPAVVLPAVVLGAAALAAATTDASAARVLPRPVAWSMAAVALAALLVVAGVVGGAERLDEARSQAARGDLATALESARRAQDLDPQGPAAIQLEANIRADLGQADESDAAFARAVGASPHDWTILADWASALLRRGDVIAARPLVRRAIRLNPREPRLTLLRRDVGL
ncbi:tetratricopeptide repeat protein [Miltoncostaea oceani]|uniref:tetratricopeptide repeat protein n=1 Tax=Miltoncostaea oceani TaxID=2843216 RepID=UPI001C3DEFC9|nr:tetratricopeptide repeat protein [Miltoncostaea oceani]